MVKFIAIEGLDGSGKGTQTALLEKRYSSIGTAVRRLDFPNYKSDSSAAVRMYLSGEMGSDPDDINAYAASSFFAVDRYIGYKTDWKRDIEDNNTVVIANRYTTANAYHQLAKMPPEEWDSFLSWLWDYEFVKLALPVPDMTILFDVPPEYSRRLIEKRCRETGVKKDIHERDAEYLTRCYRAARFAAEKWGWRVIDCVENGEMLPIDEIFERLCAVIGEG